MIAPELFFLFVLAGSATGFLLGMAIGLSLYCRPEPVRLGFSVIRHVDE